MATAMIKKTPTWVSVTLNKAYNTNYVNVNNCVLNAEKCEELKIMHLYGQFETNTALEAYSNIALVEFEGYAPNTAVCFGAFNENQTKVHDFWLGTDRKIRFCDVTRVGGAAIYKFNFIYKYT